MSVQGDKASVSDFETASEPMESTKTTKAVSEGEFDSEREEKTERTRFGFLKKRRTRKFPEDRSDLDESGDQAILVENEETEPTPPPVEEKEPPKDTVKVINEEDETEEEEPKTEEKKPRRLRYLPATIRPLRSSAKDNEDKPPPPPYDDVEDQSNMNQTDGDEADTEGEDDPGRLSKFRRRVSDKVHNAEFKRPELKNPFKRHVEEPGTPPEYPPVEGESQTVVQIPAYPMKPSYINALDHPYNAPSHHHHNQGYVGVQAGTAPLIVECPNCRCIVKSYTQRRSGAYAWFVCLMFLMLGFLFFCIPWLCSCCPFCNRTYKDVEHYCPKCHACLGRYKRVQWFCC